MKTKLLLIITLMSLGFTSNAQTLGTKKQLVLKILVPGFGNELPADLEMQFILLVFIHNS